jgi:hypothetical protein
VQKQKGKHGNADRGRKFAVWRPKTARPVAGAPVHSVIQTAQPEAPALPEIQTTVPKAPTPPVTETMEPKTMENPAAQEGTAVIRPARGSAVEDESIGLCFPCSPNNSCGDLDAHPMLLEAVTGRVPTGPNVTGPEPAKSANCSCQQKCNTLRLPRCRCGASASRHKLCPTPRYSPMKNSSSGKH